MEVTKKLRAYQVRLVTDVCRTTVDVLVEQPTGSGNTVQMVSSTRPTVPDEPTPGTFAYIEHKIRQSAVGTEFGTAFEWLCRFLLLNAPKYKGMFKQVWLWKDWPGRWGADKGIDLVAETSAGELWAVQAKAVRFDRSIPKSELSSFLSESNRPQFDYRLIVATTDDIGRNAQDTIAGTEDNLFQGTPFSRRQFGTIAGDSEDRWKAASTSRATE
jgi:hypothetical protein